VQDSNRALLTKDLLSSGLLRDSYVADLFGRLQVMALVCVLWPGWRDARGGGSRVLPRA
jgi:hypothetical protein